ncbi:MAG: thioredoxin-disulfide reductase [Candidatus Shapirobacteria bacterium]
MEKEIYDTVIVGSGPAGLTAAIYNVRAALKTMVVGGDQPGGQLTITTMVDNFPGFPTGVGGIKLMMDMMAQVKNLGVEIKGGLVEKIKPTSNLSLEQGGGFEVRLTGGETINTKAVIVATGAKAKWLGIPKENELIGKGVSGCATCDGMFFRDKVVAVVGGGDTACEDAEFLARMASRVYLIHRRDQLRASVAEQKKVLNNPKIEMIWNNEVVEILGEDRLTSIKLKNNQTGKEKIMPIDGLFVAIGHIPATNFVEGVVDLKEEGQIINGKNSQYPTMTSMEGIFAAGDCVDDVYRQAIVAAGDGCRAALDAERWLNHK